MAITFLVVALLALCLPLCSAVRVDDLAGMNEWQTHNASHPKVDMAHDFVLHLAKDQGSFFDQCYNQQPSSFKDPVASCGNAVKCFTKLFSDKKSAAHRFNKDIFPSGELSSYLSDSGFTADLKKRDIQQVLTLHAAKSDLRKANLEGLGELEHNLASKDGKARVFIPYLAWHHMKVDRNKKQIVPSGLKQNHVFIIMKSGGPDPKFWILQAYREQQELQERGYDLNDWLCSANMFAKLDGFGHFTMSMFLHKLEQFINNKMFDAELFSEMFLVNEKIFAGQRYLSTFTWQELAISDKSPESKIGKMIQGLTKASRKEKQDFNDVCQDYMKVHGGVRLPGETLFARPGTLPGYGPEDALNIDHMPNSSEVLMRDKREMLQ